MKIKYDAVSDVGAQRSNNEDMALVFGAFLRDDAQRSMVPMKRRPRFTALVADGMGGYGGGEVASEMTLHSFDDFLTSLPDGLEADEVKRAVKDWFARNNAAIMASQASNSELAHMGTTLTGIFSYGPYEFMVNTGDSRVYRRRYDTLRQLTTDHSERERLGDPTVPANLIYNAIGAPDAFVDIICLTEELPLVDGDTYIICSDGLHDMIPDERIDEILASGGTARTLVDAAIEAGGNDNCTVVLLQLSIPEDYDPRADMAAAKAEAAQRATVENIDPIPEIKPEPAAPALENYRPVAVPLEAARGFSIDDDTDNSAEEAAQERTVTPPPYIPPTPASPAPPSLSVEEIEIVNDTPIDDTVGHRARTAGRLFKEALNVLFKPKSKE